jgi:hypothetical protein
MSFNIPVILLEIFSETLHLRFGRLHFSFTVVRFVSIVKMIRVY